MEDERSKKGPAFSGGETSSPLPKMGYKSRKTKKFVFSAMTVAYLFLSTTDTKQSRKKKKLCLKAINDCNH